MIDGEKSLLQRHLQVVFNPFGLSPVTLKMEVKYSSETLVLLTRATRQDISQKTAFFEPTSGFPVSGTSSR
jgi:hypothetical protein